MGLLTTLVLILLLYNALNDLPWMHLHSVNADNDSDETYKKKAKQNNNWNVKKAKTITKT